VFVGERFGRKRGPWVEWRRRVERRLVGRRRVAVGKLCWLLRWLVVDGDAGGFWRWGLGSEPVERVNGGDIAGCGLGARALGAPTFAFLAVALAFLRAALAPLP
jgi:hypothetical protein